MSYEKLGFESGQVLKAEHLNHIEDGIAAAGGGGAFVVKILEIDEFDDAGYALCTLDKTYDEILQAFESGMCIELHDGFITDEQTGMSIIPLVNHWTHINEAVNNYFTFKLVNTSFRCINSTEIVVRGNGENWYSFNEVEIPIAE